MNTTKTRLTKDDYATIVLALEYYHNHLEKNYKGLPLVQESVMEIGKYFASKCEEWELPLDCIFTA